VYDYDVTSFDREMRHKGYQLTRYADDWVVTCASATEARAALAATASQVLKALGVTINPQKTRIVHIRQGFQFLGYKLKRGSRRMRLSTSKIKSDAQQGSLYACQREIGQPL
jgi:RNA-directed DNA polymerase